MLKIGLVGYSGAGKSTAFRWLTGVEPDPARVQQGQTGMTKVIDERLTKMAAKYKPKKLTYAEVAFLDTPGLMLDERKDNPRRLGVIREAGGMCVVLDGFSGTNPAEQLRKFREELLFADLEIITNRMEKLGAQLKRNKPAKEKEQDQAELDLLQRIATAAEAGQPAGTLGLKAEEEKLIRSFQLLTLKPEIVLLNIGDSAIGKPIPADLVALAPTVLSAPIRLELELAELDEESRTAFMSDLGITGFTREKTIRDLFYALGQIVFFTVGPDECRSWPILKGESAVEAAGAIHSDLAKRFVRAEVVGYSDFEKVGYSEKDAKAAGVYRLEGKTYTVVDGDIMHIL